MSGLCAFAPLSILPMHPVITVISLPASSTLSNSNALAWSSGIGSWDQLPHRDLWLVPTRKGVPSGGRSALVYCGQIVMGTVSPARARGRDIALSLPPLKDVVASVAASRIARGLCNFVPDAEQVC